MGAKDESPESLLRMSVAVLHEVPTMPVRATAIPEKGGKIRVASLHNCCETYVARAIMTRHIPYLKALGCSRAILKHNDVVIRRTHGGMVFSADLSRATERISHVLAATVWSQWCRTLKEPNWILQAGLKIFSPKLLPDGSLTRNSVHMGLGISWVVLCIINASAALQAGIKLPCFAICGDDLIAHATPQQIHDYKKNLTLWGLQANEEKEFIAEHGVFCERMCIQHESHVVSVEIPKISELGATKYRTFHEEQAGSSKLPSSREL
jgi:hypothetical protein